MVDIKSICISIGTRVRENWCPSGLHGLSHITAYSNVLAPIVTNKNIKMSSYKSSENIQKKEGGPDRSVSNNQSSSVTLNELAMKPEKYCNFEFQQGSHTLTDININGVQITKTV